MPSVVSGSAMIIPITPNSAPHILSESRMAAGPMPVTLPMIFGVSTMS